MVSATEAIGRIVGGARHDLLFALKKTIILSALGEMVTVGMIGWWAIKR